MAKKKASTTNTGGDAKSAVAPTSYSVPKSVVSASVGLMSLRSIWPDRLIITAEQTPSGRRYEATNGLVISDVDEADYQYLLGLTKKQSGCCGGVPNPPPVHYFAEVN